MAGEEEVSLQDVMDAAKRAERDSLPPHERIRPVKGGDFLSMEGATAVGDEDAKRRRDEAVANHNYSEQQMYEIQVGKPRPEYTSSYRSMNGALTYYDERGIMHVGYPTEENTQALRAAGYEMDTSMPVLLNSEAVINDPQLNKQYKEMIERGREKAKQERIEKHLAEYRKAAEEKGIKPVEGGEFMVVDGIPYEHSGIHEDDMVVPVNTDGYNPSRHREQVGTFGANNSTLAFVDGEGRMNIGHDTPENRSALQRSRYRKSDTLGVPFSTGEEPTNRGVRQQYQKLRSRGREKVQKERS